MLLFDFRAKLKLLNANPKTFAAIRMAIARKNRLLIFSKYLKFKTTFRKAECPFNNSELKKMS
jgi:hypothetical protein